MNDPTQYASIHHKQRGLSLIELMVASTVGLLLMAGLLQLFTSSKQTYRMSEALSRMQENGRYALDHIAKNIRMAGFQGCADPSSVSANIVAKNSPTANFSQTLLRGAEVPNGVWDPAIPADLNTATDIENIVLADSDVLVVQYGSPLSLALSSAMTATNTDLKTAGNPSGIDVGDVILVSDCDSVDIFRASGVSEAGGIFTYEHSTVRNTDANLAKPYTVAARLMRFESIALFVRDTGRQNSAGLPIYALVRRNTDGTLDELVEGVENMQVLYGEQLANGNVRYLAANDANLDMARVVSVRIGLLLHTIETASDQPDTQTYRLAGTTIEPQGTVGATVSHAKDRRIRRVFFTTVSLRNRR